MVEEQKQSLETKRDLIEKYEERVQNLQSVIDNYKKAIEASEKIEAQNDQLIEHITLLQETFRKTAIELKAYTLYVRDQPVRSYEDVWITLPEGIKKAYRHDAEQWLNGLNWKNLPDGPKMP